MSCPADTMGAWHSHLGTVAVGRELVRGRFKARDRSHSPVLRIEDSVPVETGPRFTVDVHSCPP